MSTPRRLFGLLFSSVLTLSSFAQSAPMDAVGGEKIGLNDAIQRALAKNFSIKVDGFSTAIASAQVTEALGKFDPVFNGSYTYAESFNPALADATTGLRPPPSFSKSDTADFNLGGVLPWGMTYKFDANSLNSRGTFNGYIDNYNTFAGISGTQPLLRNFGFGPTLASIRIAQVNRGISQWAFRQSVMDTISQVIFAYYDLNFSYANLHSAVRSKELAMQLVDENRKRFKVGNMSEYDVGVAESRAATRDESILFAQRAVQAAEYALKQLITDDKTPGLLAQRIAIEPPPPPPIVIVDAATDFHTALQKRPDYQQAKLALKRDGISARLQRNQLLPRVDLVGSYGYNGYDTDLRTSRQQVRSEDYHAYSWGVVVSVPLTFTTERGRYRAAKMQERQSATILAEVEQGIVVSVGNAAGQIETNQKRVQSTRHARELAQATLDAEVKRLRAGTSTTFQVAQQQEIVSGAEVSEARAQADYAKALAEYDRQLGVTLEKLNINVEPPR
ncbi:TolC family protein [Opitutus sp. GAS368]|uniref:TolC family protein n=1 Tax=Opitutus sp. GAS368 TaxID=1882749 RepID=UPI00155FF51E|nr:TolC family protein [Opitutus sp. GAS368]